MVEVAKELDISAAEVYGIASFYTFLDTQVRGKYVIRICKTITCSMKGKSDIVHTLEDILKIKVGETTADRQFSLIETNCIGWCHKAPAILINDMPYTELTPEKVSDIPFDLNTAKALAFKLNIINNMSHCFAGFHLPESFVITSLESNVYL